MPSQKHVIILGAGASFDFIDEKYVSRAADWSIYRPPLSQDILDPYRFEKIIREFPGVADLTSSVQSALRGKKDLEAFILELKNKGGHRIPQLIGFQFYLNRLFQNISDIFRGHAGNNYLDLLGRIKDAGGNACIITFNYDSLLESSLPFFKSDHQRLDDYISDNIQIVKMHGSCEWSYVFGPLDQWDAKYVDDAGSVYNYLMSNPQSVFGYGLLNMPEIIPKRNFERRSNERIWYSYPAIAIPMHSKHSHVCPASHVDQARIAIREASKILIIGWKAGDEKLLDLMEEEIKHPVEITIVSGESKYAEETRKAISQKVKKVRYKITDMGFTSFMSSTECDDFFAPTQNSPTE